jgi:adenine deaminase
VQSDPQTSTKNTGGRGSGWLSNRSGISNYGAAASETHDVVISKGRVIDPESGLDAIRNLGIKGGKIRAISADSLPSKQTIDARGLVVAPGFIDLHLPIICSAV